MNIQVSGKSFGVLALLCSSAAMAATVTIVSDTASPGAGSDFTLTIHADGMAETAGPTLGLQINDPNVTYVSGALAGPFVGGFYVPHPSSGAPDTFDLLAPGTATGSFDAAVFTFHAAADLAGGSTPVTFLDNSIVGGNYNVNATLAWFDATTFDPIATTYTQFTLPGGVGPVISVADSVIPADDHLVPFGNVDLSIDVTQTVTVTNTGDAPLNVGLLTSPSGDFSLSDDTCSNTAVAASGGTCTVTVHFIPTVNGAASSSFDIPSDDPVNATVTVNLTGTGGLPDIAITDNDAVGPADPVQFGDVQTNNNSDLLVTITNNGPGDLHIGTLTAPGDTHFTLQTNPCDAQTLTNMATCVVTVRFTPTAAGVLNSSFTIPSDDADTPTATVNLNGNGVLPPTPDIAVSLNSPHDFGDIQIGNTSPAVTVTVTNNGGADLVISALNGLAAPFAFSNDTCLLASVPPDGTCHFDLTFAPTATGAVTDTLDILSNDPDTPTVSLVLDGNGVPPPTPNISVSSTTVAFGNVLVGTTATPTTITVTNNGTANLVLGAIATANPLPAPYGIANNNCVGAGATLAPADTCTFDVTYAPTATGLINEAFDIPSNDPDENPVIVNVSGTGVAPHITVTDSVAPNDDLDVDFGNVDQSSSDDQTVTVTNDGTADLTIGDVADSDSLAAPFSIVADTCTGAVLAPTEACQITVRFAPDAVQDYADTFDIPSDASNSADVTVAVSGSGIAGGRRTNGSALDPVTLLGLGLLGAAAKRRRAARRGSRAN